MTEPILTKCQEIAKADIEQFLLAPDTEVMILAAPAGCGKSFLLEHVLGDNKDLKDFAKILDVSLKNTVEMAAMSNKAAQVIHGITMDKLLGLFPKQDYKTGKSYRMRSGGSGSPQVNKIIAIDEASMLDTEGLNHLIDLTNGCKIIFICDRYQLPPVGEKESPIFTADIPMTEMVTPVRQDADSDLYALCQALREGVRNGILVDIPESSQVKYISDAEAEDFFTNMTTDDKVLTYTNDLAIKLNNFVREYKGITGFWHKGEQLVSNGVVKRGRDTILSNEQQVTITQEPSEETFIEPNTHLEFRKVQTSAGIFNVPVEPNELTKFYKALAKAKDWRTLYPLKESIPDFRGAWSSTIHKSQGSTYRDVFINLSDLRKAKFQDKELFLRLLYVAVSRAKRNVYLYGRL